jgi:hypothetical protein
MPEAMNEKVRWMLTHKKILTGPLWIVRQVTRFSLCVTALALVLTCLAPASSEPAFAADAKSIAFLKTYLQNDNEGLEPTTDAERARMAKVEQIFKSSLESSGQFRFVPIGPGVQARISAGQTLGQCAGCEITYGKELGSDVVAWIYIQKVSNLILNLNVYMEDVATHKITFEHSVDIRGNTDETWTHAMNYLIKDYLLAPAR